MTNSVDQERKFRVESAPGSVLKVTSVELSIADQESLTTNVKIPAFRGQKTGKPTAKVAAGVVPQSRNKGR